MMMNDISQILSSFFIKLRLSMNTTDIPKILASTFHLSFYSLYFLHVFHILIYLLFIYRWPYTEKNPVKIRSKLFKSQPLNPFQSSVEFHVETSHFFCFSKQINSFYTKCNWAEMKWHETGWSTNQREK